LVFKSSISRFAAAALPEARVVVVEEAVFFVADPPVAAEPPAEAAVSFSTADLVATGLRG
jgi:hypothetical protein